MASEALTSVANKIRGARVAPGSPQPDIATRRAQAEKMAAPVGGDVIAAEFTLGSMAAEWVTTPGADPSRRLLYLHGGGYETGSPLTHRRLAGDISRDSGWAVLAIDYRMAPEDPFPAALDDALEAYEWMLANGPEGESAPASTAIAGDSAGGGLTLAALLAVRDRGIALPDCAVTLSAWTDLAFSGESIKTRGDVDTMIPASFADTKPTYLGEAGDSKDPLISPLYADYAGLPPLLMQVGDAEVLLDDTTRVAHKAEAAGVDVTCEIEPEAFHVYQMFAGLFPEAKDAVARIGAFLKKHQ